MIDLNITFLGQWAIFIFMMIFLNQFLFKPVLRVIDARREKVEGTHESAVALNERSSQHQAAYESRMTQTREKLEQESASLREETMSTSRVRMDKARSEAMQQVENMRQRIAAEYQKVQVEMTADIKVIARQISGKILERDV
ncbi:MAG: ATP synthase F0 subunit B [Pseudomonadota bacterium]|nr:ATP synthase F0 subunit B [Pseudomonadota bacterium]